MLPDYINLALESYRNYASYLWSDITQPRWTSYFYMLIVVSVSAFVLEVFIPWRKSQPILRRDFFLDVFYMFFNFFLFSLVVFNAASDVFVHLFNDALESLTGFNLLAVNPLRQWPLWAVLITGFIVRDFVQWWIHRLLHRVDFLWKFHQVHHSVKEMGFAAHLRFHWMENIVYRTLEYIPLAILGIGLYDFFVIHLFTLAWGHYNHANFRAGKHVTGGIVGGLVGLAIGIGAFDIQLVSEPDVLSSVAGLLIGVGVGATLLAPLMPYLFNSPEMHLWHHARELPRERRFGVNFGMTLSVWDYLFSTNYQPYRDPELQLGFEGDEEFPKTFVEQQAHGLLPRRGPKSGRSVLVQGEDRVQQGAQ